MAKRKKFWQQHENGKKTISNDITSVHYLRAGRFQLLSVALQLSDGLQPYVLSLRHHSLGVLDHVVLTANPTDKVMYCYKNIRSTLRD